MRNLLQILDPKFEIKYMIGRGAFSEVFKAFYKTSHKYCALKIFSKENLKNHMKQNFLSENDDKLILIFLKIVLKMKSKLWMY